MIYVVNILAVIARVKYIVLIVVKVLINILHMHHTIHCLLPIFQRTSVTLYIGSQSNKSSLTEPLPNTDISGRSLSCASMCTPQTFICTIVYLDYRASGGYGPRC